MRSFRVVNLPITLSIISLLSVGILIIYSSSRELALQQAIFAFLGLSLYIFLAGFDYRALRVLIKPLYFTVLGLLFLVIVLGVETRGSVRWIDLGFFNIQPSEFTKPILILLLADFWSKNMPTWKNIFKSFLWILPPLLLIFKQPDLGTALIIFAIWLGMFFCAKVSFKKMLILFTAIALLIPLTWFGLHDYQRQRIVSFLSPAKDPLGMGYNIIQSTIAVGSGQLFGRGLGSGTQSRLQFLPEYRTDFIFASIAEELGFLGTTLIVGIYLFLVMYSLKLAEKSADYFGFLLTCGVVSILVFQSVINIGMNIGLFPITGITLPLISYGGSSLVAIFISLGMVASVGRYQKRIDTETYNL